MNADELLVTLSMLGYNYLSSPDIISIFLKSTDIDPFLKKLLNDNKFIWIIVNINIYDNSCTILIDISSIKEKYFGGGIL